MLPLPTQLHSRLGADAQAVEETITVMVTAISDQYLRDVRAFDQLEGDNARTFAWDVREHTWARFVERLEPLEAARLEEDGLTQAVRIGPLVIRPYKLGSTEPANIELFRLDPSSNIKVGLGQRNGKVVAEQLAFDLAAALEGPDEAEIEAAYAANELVLGHFGNWRQGQRAIYLGAPRDTMKHGSYWEWVALLAGPGPDLDGEVPVPISPDGPTTPYTARREPDVPLVRRDETRHAEDQR